MREFLKDIFTLRTVWIDKGRGRWAVRKRLHPFMRGVVFLLVMTAFGIVYSNWGNSENHNAEATVAKLPEPEKKAPEIKVEVEELKPAKDNAIVIPLKPSVRTVQKAQIILPSEKDSNTDKIISTKPIQKPLAPVNNGKYNIYVNKSKFKLSLYKGSELIKEYPIAVGKNKGDKQYVGDNRTPVGNFKIVSIENASNWKHDFRDGKGKIAGAYGPWFLRLDAKGWKGIGIHGTHDPDSRGTNATEGCIRLSNEDIDELKQYAYRNMPVIIREN